MKKHSGVVTYSMFEVEMSQMFFRSCGGSTEPLEMQPYWPEIQKLKKLAQDELSQNDSKEEILQKLFDDLNRIDDDEDSWSNYGRRAREAFGEAKDALEKCQCSAHTAHNKSSQVLGRLLGRLY
jgi:hypothetical protein